MEGLEKNEMDYTLEDVSRLVSSEMGVALYFSSPNCGVCEALRPKVQKLIADKFQKIRFLEIRSNIHPEIGAHFGVFSAPTLLVFFEGREYLRYGRNFSLLELEDKLGRPYGLLIG